MAIAEIPIAAMAIAAMAIALLCQSMSELARLQPISPPQPSRTTPLEEISRSVVRLHKEHIGLGPTKARTYVGDDLVVCVLEGGFSKAERTLLRRGKTDAVIQHRQALEETLHDDLVDTVERLVERKVIGLTSGVQPDGEISTAVFLLEPKGPARGSASRFLRA